MTGEQKARLAEAADTLAKSEAFQDFSESENLHSAVWHLHEFVENLDAYEDCDS